MISRVKKYIEKKIIFLSLLVFEKIELKHIEMKRNIGKFPIWVIGIIDRKLFDVKKKKKYGIQFFHIFFKKNC